MGYIICSNIGVQHGTGQHKEDLPAESFQEAMKVGQYQRALLIFLCTNTNYQISTGGSAICSSVCAWSSPNCPLPGFCFGL